jgi:hypothetical protein
MLNQFSAVMAGPLPAIQVFLAEGPRKDMDARDKRGMTAQR